MFKRLRFLMFAAVLACPMVTNAAQIINTTGIANPAQTLTFSELVLTPEAPVTNQYASFGVTFSPSLFYNTQPEFFPSASLANFNFNAAINNPASIFFTQNQSAAAFAMQTNPGTSTFEAFLNGILVESFNAATTLSGLPDLTNASNFFGFRDIVFDEIRITSGTSFFQIDNLQFSAAVPEPASLALVGLGLLGFTVARRRKH